MAGEAKTTEFMLGTATVMFGPQADVFDLDPATNGVGLTKNVSITTEPSYTELTQGVQNNIVFSKMTANAVKASLSVYEHTAANLIYAQGLDGSTHVVPTGASTVATAVVAAATSVSVEAGDGSTFNVGDWVVIQNGSVDKTYSREITAISIDELTFAVPLPDPIPAGEVVRAASLIGLGSKENQPFLGCKIVGTTAEDEPIEVILPKVRVTAGFNLMFSSDDFQSLPFEMTVYDLVAADPHYAMFRTRNGLVLV